MNLPGDRHEVVCADDLQPRCALLEGSPDGAHREVDGHLTRAVPPQDACEVTSQSHEGLVLYHQNDAADADLHAGQELIQDAPRAWRREPTVVSNAIAATEILDVPAVL